MESRHKLSKNCSLQGKNCEISGTYNFWTSVKSNIPDVWNWNFWTLFGLEIEVCRGGGRGMASLTPQWLRPCHQLSGKISPGYRDEIATAWFYLQNLLALSRQGWLASILLHRKFSWTAIFFSTSQRLFKVNILET